MQKRLIALILAVLMIFLNLSGCGDAKEERDKKLNIVVTVFPLYDFARAVAEEKAEVNLLIDPGTEVHSYDPKPSDIKAIENADLFLMIGGESEVWAEKLIAGSDITSLKLMNKVTLYEEEHNHGEEGHTHHHDEHIWTSPSNAVKMVEAISEAVIEKDEANTDYYRANALEYMEKIKEAKGNIAAAIENSGEDYILVADRFPFLYFTEEFGIAYDAAFGGCAVSTDISVKTMSYLIERIKEKSCKKIYCTEMSNRDIADALAEETGVEIRELHSAHNVTLDDFESGVTYVDIMNRNAQVLK